MAIAYKCDSCGNKYDPYKVPTRVLTDDVVGQISIEISFDYRGDNGQIREVHFCPDCLFDMGARARKMEHE